MAGMSWDEFKECCRIQANLDLEAWDVALVQPLKDISAWWDRQSIPTQRIIQGLGGISTTALAAMLAKIGKITAAEVAGTFSVLVIAVLAGIAFGTFMDVVGRCGIQKVEQLLG